MLREFKPTDREDFIKFCHMFYTSEAVLHTVDAGNFETTFDLAIKKDPYLAGFMIVNNDESVGYALLSFTYSNEVGGLVVWLEEAYVLPEHQGHGLGKEFFAYVAEKYGNKAKRLRLEVTRSNTRAIALYKKLGFFTLDYEQMVREL